MPNNTKRSAIARSVQDGVLHVAGMSLRTYILEDGRRIINFEDMTAFRQAVLDGKISKEVAVRAMIKIKAWEEGHDIRI